MNKTFTLCWLLGLLPLWIVQAQTPCVPEYLQTEHLEHPLGIDTPQPRLSWRLTDDRTDARQAAYQLIVGTDSLSVLQGKGGQWDTGRIASADRLVTYAGKTLEPFTRYYWAVSVWDKDQQKSTSVVQAFETGLMGMNRWKGAWIDDGKDIHYRPAPYFRKTFRLAKPLKSARAYIAVAGLYELYLNGERVGDHQLDPMYTRFDRRNLYVTYDVTARLQAGENAIGVLLGNGWYNHQSMAVWDFDRAPWRNRPTFCLDLRLTYEDGTVETVATETDWKTVSGALLSNSIYSGEHYDARSEQQGWNTIAFDDSHWGGVRYRSAPSQHITAQQMYPIRLVDTLPAVTCRQLNDTTYLFDFGRNIAGITQLRAQGKAGTVLKIKHGERLTDGRLDLSNIDVYYRGNPVEDPFQVDIVTLSGKDVDEFAARFNYKGFRYAEVTSSDPIILDKNSLTAYFMHSDVPPTGRIASSNPLLNQLWQATNNAYLSNLMGYPTDCPQREKNGWTGDGHLAIETALYNFDAITVYEKWMADHRDEQQPNGVLPDIIPTGGWGYGTANGLDWTSTIALIPWNLYLFYGDSKPLSDCYENIKRYVDYVDRTSPNHLTSWGRGDWVPVKSSSNRELTSSVYFYVDATILAQAAKLFNKPEDYRYYTTLAQQIKDAINRKFLNRETGVYANGSQTGQSVPLQWKVVPEEMIAKVAGHLARKVEESGYHLDVGVLGAKAILNALSENGHGDAAYQVAVQDTYPSWGWWIVNGATTLLENWDLQAKRDISDNHMMFGEIGGWFFKGLGGIFPDAGQPGFKHIVLRPNFVKDLKFFEADHLSPYGWIKSGWKWKGHNVIYTVTVPPNATATLYLPARAKGEKQVQLNAGTHTLAISFEK